jgi:YhcN/YlaJ family sporulation lipoprotein
MKKIWMLSTVFLITCALVGCNNNRDEETNDAPANNEATDVNTEKTEGNKNTGATNNGNGELELSEEAADKIAELDEVESATVIITDNNAYVGVVLQGEVAGTDETKALDKIEDKIAEQVKSINTNVENVYVSVNPDFVDQLKDYGNKINSGEPVEGLFEEFNDIVQRIFPDAK